MSKPVILTGLRANNALHLGNYLGALLPMVDMARQRAGEYQINLFMPDLHSFTTPIDHSQLQEQVNQNLRSFVAAGLPLDNPDIHIYRQSYIPAHSELTWILSCFTNFGEMSRMTQFKDKSGLGLVELIKKALGRLRADSGNTSVEELMQSIMTAEQIEGSSGYETLKKYVVGIRSEEAAESTSVGLFNYPILMAADILLYGAEYIPVGDDQTQHLEFTRDIAERMNNRFGELFVVPKPVKDQHEFFGKDQGLRVRDLQEPTRKMSKSAASDKGVIFLTDAPEQARKKIMSAATDSLGQINYDYANQPGIANLLDMLKLLGGEPAEFIGQSQYGPLKAAVADRVAELLGDFQSRLASVETDVLNEKLTESEDRMRNLAGERLYRVQQAVGLRPL